MNTHQLTSIRAHSEGWSRLWDGSHWNTSYVSNLPIDVPKIEIRETQYSVMHTGWDNCYRECVQ